MMPRTEETANIRRQLMRVVEHWASETGVDIKPLIFRMMMAPLQHDSDDWDPVNRSTSPVGWCVLYGWMIGRTFKVMSETPRTADNGGMYVWPPGTIIRVVGVSALGYCDIVDETGRIGWVLPSELGDTDDAL